MKEKFRKAVSDPLFIRLCVLLTVMIALAVAAIIMYGKPAFAIVLPFIYVIYAVILFFFLKTLIKLYLKYFREKKERKESKLRKKLRQFFQTADEKIRGFFNIKPRSVFFGGDDTEYSEKELRRSGRREKGADRRVKWSDLKNNSEKVRYLFAARVSEGIYDGADVYASDTARQIEKKISRTERDEMLFSLYESVRYTNKNEPISDGAVSYLSERNTVQRKKKK